MSTAFSVWRKNRQGNWVRVDTVYRESVVANDVRKSLIDHDGYPGDIRVTLVHRRPEK